MTVEYNDTLRIELTPEEAEYVSAVAFRFAVYCGLVVVTEERDEEGEVFTDLFDVRVPVRIWLEAAPWIAARVNEADRKRKAGK